MSKEKAIKLIKQAKITIDVLAQSLIYYDKINQKGIELLDKALKELEE